ncbi:MAG: hypothetical protein JNL82_35085 [Myxococcales bacterium]|jgi:hypothetical protein|nr:hypothetical protein [Myxococcales bacterium]
MRIAPLLCLLALAACGPESYFEGPICPKPEALAEFMDGDNLSIEVILDDCPPGCGGNSSVSCEATRMGDEIDLDARGTYQKKGGNGSCAAVCVPIVATCNVAGLDAGTYTINSGSHSLKITIPSDDPPNYEAACGF